MIDEALPLAYELLEVTQNGPGEDLESVAGAPFAATVAARARSLLHAMCLLIEHGRGDVVGVLLRPIYEAWLVGLLLLYGDDSDRERISAGYFDLVRKLERRLDRPVGSELGDTRRLSIEHMARLLGSALERQDGQPHPGPIDLYNQLYTPESFAGTHVLGSVGGHLSSTDEGLVLLWEAKEPVEAGLARLAQAGILLAQIIGPLWEATGLDSNRIVAVHQRLGDLANV